MNKIWEIIPWSDAAIGAGFELYWRGEYLGTSGRISVLRVWARNFWQQELKRRD
jgi:hypothetical protein